MDTHGTFAPETADEARDRYETVGGTAQVVVKEVAKAMGMDADEYAERVTSEVVETARDVLFAQSLTVHVSTRTEFDDWLAQDDWTVEEIGNENVDRVAWHAAPATETAVAATFADEQRAAVEMARRQAYGRVYRPLVTGEGADGDGTDG